MPDRFLKPDEAARMLSCTKKELDELLAKGKISYILLSPRIVRISLRSVQRYIERAKWKKPR